MGLSPIVRGFLEKIIDEEIAKIPSEVEFARIPEVRRRLLLNNDYDYVIGRFFGNTLTRFSSTYFASLQNTQNVTKEMIDEGVKEGVDSLLRRISEVRTAIMNCG